MQYLLLTSFLWAFSFGLVKDQLIGINPSAVAVMRLGLAFLVFLPFLRLKDLSRSFTLGLLAVGGVQFGVMYIFYLSAFRYLQAYEVALFTALTPLYVVVLDAVLEKTWHPRFLPAALLAAVGAAVVLEGEMSTAQHHWGFFLIQAANLCFAFGQLAWRRLHARLPEGTSDHRIFALLYLGAVVVAGCFSLCSADWHQLHLTGLQSLSVIYLGIIASGLCFFWWNMGALRVNAGTLAVLNNAKMPVAVAISLFVFNEKSNILRLTLGVLAIALALLIAERRTLWERKSSSAKP